jgi:hypothetical protein
MANQHRDGQLANASQIIFRMFGIVIVASICVIFPCTVDAQDVNATTTSDSGVSFTKPVTQNWKVGVIVQATTKSVKNAYVTFPVPMDWPEQSVKIVQEKTPVNVTGIRHRTLNDGVHQVVANIVNIKPGEKVELSVVYEVTVNQIVAPTKTDDLVVPQRPSRKIKAHLSRSPQIDFNRTKFRNKVKEIVADQVTPWQQVEALYDWVRDNIKQIEDDQPQGAQSTLRHKKGSVDDLVSLFVGFCRAHKVPARSVFVEGHVYAEFYLEDAEGKGHWFPAQVAGNRDFGSMSDPRIIQQKGDNIKVPEESKRQQYVFEHVTASARMRPKVKFIRQLIQK